MYKSKLPDDAAGVISGFSALAVPYGRGSLQTFGGPSVSSTEIFKVDSCCASLGFAWQRNLRSDSHTSFSGTLLPQRKLLDRTACRDGRHSSVAGYLESKRFSL